MVYDTIAGLITAFLAGVGGGIIGGSLAKHTAIFLKDYTLKRQMKDLLQDVDDFKSRYDTKHNKLARSVQNALKDWEFADPEHVEQPANVLEGIPPELMGLASSLGIDIQKVLTGDQAELGKIKQLLDAKQGSGKIEGGL